MRDLACRAFDRVDQEACDSIDDLQLDTANGAGNNRFVFPKGFTDRESEPFSEGLLNNDCRSSDKGIDLEVAEWRQQQHVNIGIYRCSFVNFAQHFGASRIIVGTTACKDELAVVPF